jgi:hypothetical protein
MILPTPEYIVTLLSYATSCYIYSLLHTEYSCRNKETQQAETTNKWIFNSSYKEVAITILSSTNVKLLYKVYSTKWNPLIECISPLIAALLLYNLRQCRYFSIQSQGSCIHTGLHTIYADDNCCTETVQFSVPC